MKPEFQPYARCVRCGCLRREKDTYPVQAPDGSTGRLCTDAGFCTRAAGVGQGRLDADAGTEVKP